MCLAVPGKIVKRQGSDSLEQIAEVDFGGVMRAISLACLPEAKVGDYIIAHAGVALQIIDEDEANKIISELEQLKSGQG